MRRRARVPRPPLSADELAVSRCPLYGISPLALANLFHLPEAFCVEWKAQLRADPAAAAAVARFVNRDLGAFDPAFSGWLCKDGLIWPSDGPAATPAQIRAIPAMRDQLREFDRAQRWMIEQSHAELLDRNARIEVADLLQRAIKALR